MVKRAGKRGDTLIEVMLAVGIFSMVAVAVVAVMSGGTSSAQTALETTLTREEIDTQAEALRFIQSSYIAEKGNADGKFGKIWKLITAADPTNDKNVRVVVGEENIATVTQYSSSKSECSALYSDTGEAKQYGFVINPRALNAEDPSVAIVRAQDSNKFTAASTYPRLIYGDDNLLVSSATGDLQKVEGIYVVAVKDPDSTNITDKGKTSAYYDFYIRTCWYGTGDKVPSTISTVMRLYDPGVVNN